MTPLPKDKQVAERLLRPLIKYAANNKGTMTKLAVAMTAKLNRSIPRQQVEKWLHPDPERRIEPGLGLGTLLIEAGNKVMKNGHL